MTAIVLRMLIIHFQVFFEVFLFYLSPNMTAIASYSPIFLGLIQLKILLFCKKIYQTTCCGINILN